MTNHPSSASSQFDLSLAHEAMFSVADACGVQVSCREGCLWVTLDHDTRDIVLSAGESFITTKHRRALIYALGPSSLSLSLAPALARPARVGRKPAGGDIRMTLALQTA